MGMGATAERYMLFTHSMCVGAKRVSDLVMLVPSYRPVFVSREGGS